MPLRSRLYESTGKPGQELLYRDDEPRLTVEQAGRAWSMDADGALFRLVSEAKRISLAYLFDPFLAVQTSNLDPLPHQIEAVYSKMLPRQPLRYLLADDPGAGKTIMAGLFCKELMIRGDVERPRRCPRSRATAPAVASSAAADRSACHARSWCRGRMPTPATA
jgi:hypothetical protein